MTAPQPASLPTGFRIELDPGARQLTHDLWFGGSPAQIVRLTKAGRAAWQELKTGQVLSAGSGALARRFTDAGLAHPRLEPVAHALDVTVVVPVRDRADMLDHCLRALGPAYPVVVVDDGSCDPRAVAEAAERHGAALLRHAANYGPAAARNTALKSVASEIVAFVDSDCVPGSGWIESLAAHFADPLVAAVAPRITALAAETRAGRYTRATSSLDLGGQSARVAPNTRVSYVPTAALVARRAALLDVARGGEVFDASLRVGEDVDLVWRLDEAGWRVRYDASVTVGHKEPAGWTRLLERRFRYGTSAAPLARRHPRATPPLVLHPWPALTAAALLAGRPAVAAGSLGASTLTMAHALRRAQVPTRGMVPSVVTAVYRTWLGIGRYGTQFGSPLLALAVSSPGGRTPARRLARRAAAASLLLGPPVTTWITRRPALDPVCFVLGSLADDIAYGSGVWAGCLAERTAAPLRPVIAWRALRTAPRREPPGPRDRSTRS